MAGHAKLGPSGAKRWLSCTPSMRFEQQFIDKSSSYAQEGTAAHEYSEIQLNLIQMGHDPDKHEAVKEFRETNEWYNGEMDEAISIYIDIIMERYNEARARSADAVMFIEERLDFSEYVPEGFGTGDVLIIADGILEVIDLKYGKGIAVDAEDNPQLRLYGLGAYLEYSLLYDIDTVRMTIVQPRLNSITTDAISVEDLIQWAEKDVQPKALMAWEGEGEFIPGDHCQFCKGKPKCKALADYNLELFKYDLVKGNLLLNEDIAEILGKVDTLTRWASDLKSYALKQAEQEGIKYPGWKLVEGRSNRKYLDELKIVSILKDNGYKEPMLYKPRQVETLGNMESLVGKKKFTELCGEYIVKPAGKPTLVKETDKRPEMNTADSAKSDFAEALED